MPHESLLDRFDALHLIEYGGAGVFGLKLDRPGGFSNVRKVNAIAEVNNIPCFMCSAIELGISTAAALHLAVSQKNISLASEFSGPQTIVDGRSPEPRFRGGRICETTGRAWSRRRNRRSQIEEVRKEDHCLRANPCHSFSQVH